MTVWTVLPNLPVSVAQNACCVDAAGNVHVFGGADINGAAHANHYKYVPGSGWITESGMPAAAYDHRTVRTPDGLLWVIGGYNGAGLTGVNTWDEVHGHWNVVQDLPAARERFAVAAAADGTVFVIGGDPTHGLPLTTVYACVSGNWVEKSPIPLASPTFMAATTAPDGLIYVLITASGDEAVHFYAYNPSTDTWSELAAALRAGSLVTRSDGSIWLVFTDTGAVAFQAYNRDTGVWADTGVTFAGNGGQFWSDSGQEMTLDQADNLYVIGGYDSSSNPTHDGSTTTLPAPTSAGVAVTYWDGATEESCTVTYWDGAAEQSCTLEAVQ